MSARWIWYEATALVLGLVLVEMGLVLVELRTAIVQNWFVTLAPLIWLNASILVLFLFFRQLGSSDVGSAVQRRSETTRGRPLLAPRFGAIRQALRPPSIRIAVLLIALGYGFFYAILQGIILLTPNTVAPLGPLVLESPIGYGPALVWAPTQGFAVLLRPYTVAAAVALAVLSGLVLGLFIQIATWDRRALTSLTGPLAGLAVLCPACFATPAAGLFVAVLAPAITLGTGTLDGLGTVSSFAFSLGLATALLLASLLLLWATAAWLSRLLPPTPTAASNGRGR